MQMPKTRLGRERFKSLSLLLAILLVCLALPRPTHSQSATAILAIPQRIIYKQVFQHIVFLDSQADAVEQHGHDASALRNYYRVHANLSAPEDVLLKQAAHDTTTAIRLVDQQIQVAVRKYRALFPNGRISNHSPFPSPPAELTILQEQKDKIVLDHLALVQGGLSPAHFQAFDAFVQTTIAPHITLTAAAPGPHVPDRGKSLRPLSPVEW